MNIKHTSSTAHGSLLALGVTGGLGSGKSLVCRRLNELGVPVCSADELARKAVEPGTTAHRQITGHFGAGILRQDGTIDRPALRRIIAGDERARKTLEGMVHPEVLEQIKGFIRDAGKKGAQMAAVEVPLLFETGMQDFFDFVILVTADDETRIQRIIERDKSARHEAEALMKSQMPEEEKQKLADFVIENNGTVSDVYADVDRICRRLGSGEVKK